MEAYTMLMLCLLFQGVNTLVTTTYPGISVRIDAKTHVLPVNQSNHFIFEVQSCGTVNLTIVSQGQSPRVDISFPTSLMIVNVCSPEDGKTTLNCAYYGEKEFATSSCSTSSQFWVDVPYWTGYFIGSGCDVRINSIYSLTTSGSEMGFDVLVASDAEATWKFGEDACTPPTTTTSTTSTISTTTTTKAATTAKTNNGSGNGIRDLICKSAGVSCFPAHGKRDMCLFIFFIFLLFILT